MKVGGPLLSIISPVSNRTSGTQLVLNKRRQKALEKECMEERMALSTSWMTEPGSQPGSAAPQLCHLDQWVYNSVSPPFLICKNGSG